MHNNDPVALVETVAPIVLGTKIVESCNCGCDCCEIPDAICNTIDGDICTATEGPKLVVSLGIFSIIRIERDAQLLIQATDYSVPDKECVSANNDDNPCALFNTIAFPTQQFKTVMCPTTDINVKNGGCGCGR